MYEDILVEQVKNARVPVFPKTKAQIVNHFKDTYGQSWASHAAAALSGETTGKAYRNARRNFEGDRAGKDSKTAKWESFGRKLPPTGYKPPAKGYAVTFTGSIRISNNCYYRSFTRHITGSDAVYLTNNPEYATIFDNYFEDEDPGFASETCEPPTVIITAL